MAARHRLLASIALLTLALPAKAGPIRAGFDAASLPATDDGSSGALSLGFGVNFFGQSFSSIYVNNNGNLSFGNPVSDFAPVPLGQLRNAMIAPFFADVDTSKMGRVSYGVGSVDGHRAFAATWSNVGYNGGTGAGNDFQAVLVDRGDTGAGNFDVEYNYGKLNWETGNFNGGVGGKGGSSARAGFADADPASKKSYELPGSGTPGAFLDGSPTALALGSFNSPVTGRYEFLSRDGDLATPAGPAPSDPGTPGPPTPPATPGDPTPPGPTPVPLPSPTPGGPVGTPEPSSAVLAALGLGAVWLRVRRGK